VAVDLERAAASERHQGPLVGVLEPVERLPRLGERADVLGRHLHRARGVRLSRSDLGARQQGVVLAREADQFASAIHDGDA
jgi:hypothetical protein